MRMLSLMLFVLVSCAKPVSKPVESAPKAGKTEKSKNDEITINATVTAPMEDEKVSPPAQVSGAALHCSIASEISAADPVIGCRIDDKNGVRIPLANLADRAVFSFVPPADAAIKVEMKQLASNEAYDVAYIFKGMSREQAEAAAMLTRVMVSFEGLKIDIPPVVSGVIKDILVTGAEILKGLVHVANVIAGEIQRNQANASKE